MVVLGARLWELFKNNVLWNGVFLAFSVLLTREACTSIFVVLLNALFVQVWAWGVHYISHMCLPVFERFDAHMKVHHVKENRSFLLDIWTECLMQNALVLLYVILPIFILGLEKWILMDVILYFTISYTSVHIINYSLRRSHIHVQHHVQHKETGRVCNLGPDWLDHVFGTSCDGRVEKSNEFFINFFSIGMVMLALQTWCV